MKQVKKNNKLLSMSTSIIPFLSQRNEQSKLSNLKKTMNKLRLTCVKAILISKYKKRENRTTIYKLNTVSITPH